MGKSAAGVRLIGLRVMQNAMQDYAVSDISCNSFALKPPKTGGGATSCGWG